MKRFITLDNTNKVVAVRIGTTIANKEIESELGELGQFRHTDGTFTFPEPVTTEIKETLEQKIERLEKQRQEDNLMQLEVLASIYEEILMKG